MTDITAFLTARLDEDEALAEVQPPWPWSLNAEGDEVIAEDGIEVASAFALSNNQQRNIAAHIVRHEPARVLADVAAKRALIQHHEFCAVSRDFPPSVYDLPQDYSGKFIGHCELCSSGLEGEGLSAYYEPWPCPSLRIMASIHADHPDYDESWRA